MGIFAKITLKAMPRLRPMAEEILVTIKKHDATVYEVSEVFKVVEDIVMNKLDRCKVGELGIALPEDKKE